MPRESLQLQLAKHAAAIEAPIQARLKLLMHESPVIGST